MNYMRHLLNSQISPSKSFSKLHQTNPSGQPPNRIYSEFSICDCAEQVKSLGNNLLEGMPFSINVQGLNLTPTLYCSVQSYCTKAHSNLRYLFHYCLINLLIAMSLLLGLFNYPAACDTFILRLQLCQSALRPITSFMRSISIGFTLKDAV